MLRQRPINRGPSWAWLIPILIMVAVVLAGIAGIFEEEHERLELDRYCHMVRIHEQSDGAVGWPPHRENTDELCAEEDE